MCGPVSSTALGAVERQRPASHGQTTSAPRSTRRRAIWSVPGPSAPVRGPSPLTVVTARADNRRWPEEVVGVGVDTAIRLALAVRDWADRTAPGATALGDRAVLVALSTYAGGSTAADADAAARQFLRSSLAHPSHAGDPRPVGSGGPEWPGRGGQVRDLACRGMAAERETADILPFTRPRHRPTGVRNGPRRAARRVP